MGAGAVGTTIAIQKRKLKTKARREALKRLFNKQETLTNKGVISEIKTKGMVRTLKGKVAGSMNALILSSAKEQLIQEELKRIPEQLLANKLATAYIEKAALNETDKLAKEIDIKKIVEAIRLLQNQEKLQEFWRKAATLKAADFHLDMLSKARSQAKKAIMGANIASVEDAIRGILNSATK